jgi:hypothetical protein
MHRYPDRERSVDASTVALVVGIFSPLATLAAGFGGTWLGARLSETSLKERRVAELRERRDERDEERKRIAREREAELRNVRLLLHLEVQHNLDRLKELHDHLILNREGNELEFQAEARFIAATLPVWGHLMFDTLAVRVPEALAPEAVTRMYSLYSKLERLTTLQQTLATTLPPNLVRDFFVRHADLMQVWRRGEAQESDQWYRYDELSAFKAASWQTWSECQSIINGLIAAGNPIPEQ